MWLMLAFACTETPEDDGLVSWSGWLYAGAESTEEARLLEGALTVWPEPFTAGGERVGEQPYADYPGYWDVRVPPGAAVNVRVESPDTRPTLWAGDAPLADGNWFAGALFGATDAWLRDLFDTLTNDGDVWLSALDAGQVLVVGAPANDAFGCESLTITAEAGLPAAPACWTVNDDGVATQVSAGAATWFAALAPAGALTVGIGAAVEPYNADAGDVVMAWYLSEGLE